VKPRTMLLVAGAALVAAPLFVRAAPMFGGVQTPAPQTDVAALQSEVQALSSKVATLEAKLEAAQKLAGDANFKAGLATIWINKNGDNFATHADAQYILGAINSLTAKADDLAKRFAAHRHRYTYHYQHPDGTIVDIKSATGAPCDDPNSNDCQPWTTH